MTQSKRGLATRYDEILTLRLVHKLILSSTTQNSKADHIKLTAQFAEYIVHGM